MFKNCLAVLFLFISFTTSAQPSEIDSLKQALNTNQHDTIRVNQLNALAHHYAISNPDTSFILAQEAIDLARKADFNRGEARGLSVSGSAFSLTGNNPKALELFLSSLKKYEAINDLEGIANSTNNIGAVYTGMEQYDKGLKYFFETLKIDNKVGNKNNTGITLANIGEIFYEQEKIDSARSYGLRAYDLALIEKNNYLTRTVSGLLGKIYDKTDQPAMAKEYFKTGFNKDQLDVISSNCALGLAKIFRERKQPDSTLYYAKYAYAIANKAGFTSEVIRASDFLAEYYESNKSVDSAYAYLKISLTAKDSLFDQEKRNKIQALSLEETARQQEIETALSEMKNKEKVNIQYLGITAVIVGFVLLFLLLSRSVVIGGKWLGFLGVFILLLVFEFINLYFTPIISEATDYSPVWTLLIMVGIAALLVPMHHKTEKYVTKKIVAKNKEIKIAAARKTLEKLEDEK